MSDDSYYYFLSERAAGFRTAQADAEANLGGNAFLFVVPYFQLPQTNEPFDDTENRFPQLASVTEFLESSDYRQGEEIWFAEVLPGPNRENNITQLAIKKTEDGSWKLIPQFGVQSRRYIAVLPREDTDGKDG